MSNAFKCDRCGKYFDGNTIPLKRYIVIGNRLQPAYGEKDLCKDCYKSLMEFLKSGDA